MTSDLLAFTALAVVLVITPGPDSMLVLGRAVREGRASALGAAGGVVTGLTAWAAASAVGVAAFVTSSGAVYDALRYVGAAYLVWIGVQHLRSTGSASDGGGRSSFATGLATNLLNPKIAVFYVSVLPQFGDNGGEIAALAAVHVVLSLVWLAGVAVAGSRAASGLRPAVQRRLEVLGGGVLVALGVRLAVSRS